MRIRLQLTWMLTASTALATSFTLTSMPVLAAEGDGRSHIASTEEHGRTIYVNEDGPAKERPAPTPQPRRSTLVYWSSKDNRWKPVPSASTASGKAARSAAAEVSEFYGHDSVQSANANVTVSLPITVAATTNLTLGQQYSNANNITLGGNVNAYA